MAITIQADKFTNKLQAALQKGQRPDLCFYLSGGGRIGLPAYKFQYPSPPGDLTGGDWPRVLAANNISQIGVLQNYKFCDGDANYTISSLASSLNEVLAAPPETPPRPAPRAKTIVEQFVEGFYKLVTTNPAILTCVAVAGPACPAIQLLYQAGLTQAQVNQLLAAWAGFSAVEITNQISTACRALGIPASQCPSSALARLIYDEISKKIGITNPIPPVVPPTTPTPQPTGQKCTLMITLNNAVLGTFEADLLEDGSCRFLNIDIPIVGIVSGSIRFSDCSLSVTSRSGVLNIPKTIGVKLGAKKCKFQHESYTVIIEAVGDGIVGVPSTKDEYVAIGVLAFLAIVAIILVAGR